MISKLFNLIKKRPYVVGSKFIFSRRRTVVPILIASSSLVVLKQNLNKVTSVNWLKDYEKTHGPTVTAEKLFKYYQENQPISTLYYHNNIPKYGTDNMLISQIDRCKQLIVYYESINTDVSAKCLDHLKNLIKIRIDWFKQEIDKCTKELDKRKKDQEEDTVFTFIVKNK